MRSHRAAGRILMAPALGLALAAAITACSSSSNSGSTATASPSAAKSSASPGTGTSSTAAIAEVKANWTKLFNGSTPTSQRVALLQNGQAFAKELGSLAAFGSTASAKVSAVKLTGPKQATVTYTIYLGKQAMLSNEKGVAVLDNGTWKVSDASLCELLTLENAGKAPAVCSSAS